ncbi:hypothetical protein [Streptomyces sp. NPDC101393]|uniref:hypothetical protein n=1 Tax=Streptomyces sp. NPDC101393 TaxID=3366141 RepID=UPI00382C929B
MSFSSSHRADSGSDRNADFRTSAKHRGQRRADKSPARRTLPSYRANPRKQVNVFLGLADLVIGTAPVQRAALAEHVGIGAATVGDCMAFLADIGLVEAGRGQYLITERGRAFADAWRRDRDQARQVLRPLLAAHWSAAAASRHLARGPVRQEELARLLRAGLPGVPMRGHYMVEWLEIALIVERDEERLEVHLPGRHAPRPPQSPDSSGEQEGKEGAGQEEGAGVKDRDGSAADGTRADAADSRSIAGAALLLGMSRQEIQELPDARYSAFLEGILQTLHGALAPTA